MLARLTLPALTLSPPAFRLALAQLTRTDLIVLVLLAAASEALGQSAVLLINRVRPRRFALALASSMLVYVTNYVLWVAGAYLVLRFAFPGTPEPPLDAVARLVALGYVPRLLAFLLFTPYLGQAFGVAISIWSLLTIQLGLQHGFDLRPGPAAVAAIAGWLAMEATRRTFGYPLIALERWVTRRASGTELELDSDALYRELGPGLERLDEEERR